MSTTFEVYPRTQRVPTFGKLIELASIRLAEQLERRHIAAKPQLKVQVLRNRSHDEIAIALDAQMIWERDQYAWITVPGVLGGTDVDYRLIDELTKRLWNDLFEVEQRAKELRTHIEACLSTGHYWSFRRSAGQPAIINFAYGIIAASLAELTDGIIYSDDSAWDYDRFPAVAIDFYEWFFDPEKTPDLDRAAWARACLSAIASDQRL
ncbi:hypothetical protein [Variovorax sp. UC74_104]|uniref:hypothetical protein n=1 Tax=Variovorax sp. UC74_104 TaxID=3374555 RepID=UPI0037577683